MPEFNEPVTSHARADFPRLRLTMTIRQALDTIRQTGLGEKVIYFYVVDDHDRLVGVIPTRRLLTAELDQRVGEVMVPSVVAIPDTATVLEACEYFVLHRFLAFPVIDGEGRIVGVVDAGQFADEVLDFAEREQADTVFESLGFRVSQVRGASPMRAFGVRFPWLLATIASGTACAFLAGAFEATLAQSLMIAFFMTLVLGLGESVSMQSMTVTIQALRAARPTVKWYLSALGRELQTAGLLGVACGVTVAAIAWLWRGDARAAFAIGGSIVLSLLTACVLGLSVPWALHAARLDPRIAAGPVALAMTDIATLLFYFSIATALL
jgi:magnesium transporter